MTTATIKAATKADEAAVVDVITLAFGTDPVTRWVWPDPHQYVVYMPALVRAFGGGAFPSESAYYADGYAGAALWLPPEVHPAEDKLESVVREGVAEARRGELFAVFEKMGGFHPQEPHWYLPLIGVDPSNQGRGYGSALMRHALQPCDRDRTIAYLESSNPRNLSLYPARLRNRRNDSSGQLAAAVSDGAQAPVRKRGYSSAAWGPCLKVFTNL